MWRSYVRRVFFLGGGLISSPLVLAPARSIITIVVIIIFVILTLPPGRVVSLIRVSKDDNEVGLISIPDRGQFVQ